VALLALAAHAGDSPPLSLASERGEPKRRGKAGGTDAREQGAGECIGDGRTSPASSRAFFQGLDIDADGVVEKHEMIEHLTHFGGKALDEPDEIQRSMEYAFRRVDTNKDGELDAAESHFFWRQLGSMLSVDEVAEWVVHGLQLPQEVGEAFRENSVDAYEFPELVKNDGEALELQVGIARQSQRRKLLRYMRMVLSGVAVLPETPQLFLVEPVGCSSSHLRWAKPNGRGWDPHTYRIFRRRVDPGGQPTAGSPFTTLPSFTLYGSGLPSSMSSPTSILQAVQGGLANSNSVVAKNAPFASNQVGRLPQRSKSSWELVFHGSATEAEDVSMDPGTTYEYRLEAWNVFGRSEARQTFVAGDLQLSCSLASHYFNLVYRMIYLFVTVVPMCLSVLAFIFRSARLYAGKKDREYTRDDFVWQLARLVCKLPGVGHYVDHFLPDPVFGRSADHGPRPDGTVSPRAVGTHRLNGTDPSSGLAVLPEHSTDSQRRNTTRCYHCHASFLKWKRRRHHCCICGKSFCAKHGVVNHSWMRTCPVGGRCTCGECAGTNLAVVADPAEFYPLPPQPILRHVSLSTLSSSSASSTTTIDTTSSLPTLPSEPLRPKIPSMASLPHASRPRPLAPNSFQPNQAAAFREAQERPELMLPQDATMQPGMVNHLQTPVRTIPQTTSKQSSVSKRVMSSIRSAFRPRRPRSASSQFTTPTPQERQQGRAR